MRKNSKRSGIEYFPKKQVHIALQIPILEMIKKDAKKQGIGASAIVRDCVLDRYLKRYLEHLEKQMRREIEAIEKEEENNRSSSD